MKDELYQYLLENSRPMTDEEREAHSKAIQGLFKPTGRNLFESIRKERTAQEGVSGKEENNG